MKLSRYLGDKPFWSVASRLAVPIALQNVLTSSFVLVDTMMVSRLGDLTLSAVGMAGQWAFLCNLLGFGLCSGMSVFVAQYWGVRDLKGIRRVMGIALSMCLLLSMLFLGIAALAPEFVLGMFNQDPEVIAEGSRYLSIAAFSYPATLITNILATVLRNTERVKLPLYVSVVTTLTNALANYGLIFGKFGLPQMGVAGAALATCISAWLGPVLLLSFSAIEKNMLTGPIRELLSFGWQDLKVFFSKAMPVVVNEGMWALGVVVQNMIYSNMGYEYYAGLTVYKTFADLCFAFYAGLGNACVIMVGKSVGQGKIRRAAEDAVRFGALVPLSSAVLGLLVILLRHPLISIFSTGDTLSALTLQTALAVTVFASIEGIVRNIPYIQIVGVFRSGGDTVTGMIMDLCCLWLVSIPAALLASRVLGLPFLGVVMVTYLAEDLPKALLCLRHTRSMRWIKPVTPEGKEGLEAYLAEHK